MNSAKKDYRIVLLVALCLIAAIIIVYGKVKTFDFVGYDDELYVTKNLYVQKGISPEGLKWAFTTFHSANWHPLTWISHMLDCELYGLNPSGHHWTNVEFHIANTLLLFIILFKMTGAIWQSAFVAALFALHPLHVESVAWVSERKDVLSTFFGPADHCRLLLLCKKIIGQILHTGYCFIKYRSYGKTHAGDNPVCSASAGFLAA